MISNYPVENVEIIVDYMRKQGFNNFAIAGALANIYAESRLKPNNMQNSYEAKLGYTDDTYVQAVDNGTYTEFGIDRCGFGLCQWTSSGRKTGLLNFAKANGKSIADLRMQLDWFMHELKTSYKKVYNGLLACTSYDEAARLIMTGYEKPANQSEENQLVRVGYAKEFYDTYLKEEAGEQNLRICLDAGHGLNTAGKRCLKSLDPKETREWVLNSRIAEMLEKHLANYQCEVLRVDDTTGKTDVGNTKRTEIANEWNADVYISIHHNAGLLGKLIGYKNKKAGGTVVYYSSSKPERPVQAENLYKCITDRTLLFGDRAQTVIKKGFTVIAKTKMPAFLIENGFMDSPTDVPIILSEEHAKQTALGILQFLQDSFKLKEKEVSPPSHAPEEITGYLVKIVTDTLPFVDEPPKTNGKVKKGEVYTITEERDGYGKLKSGAGWLALYGTERI